MNEDIKKEHLLLEKVAQKDKAAFEALYHLLSKPVFHYLYRLLQNRETAEDVLIEVFAVVWKSADRFKGNSRVKTWVFGIARNQAFNELRKKGRYSDQLNDTIKDDKSETPFKGFENRQQVQRAISKLSARHREILDLVFFHDSSYAQISRLLKIPENTVKTRVYYAKSALKQIIIEMEGDVT